MVNITNTKPCPYISPPVYKPPMYKPTKKCLRTNISPGLIFGGLRYMERYVLPVLLNLVLKRNVWNVHFVFFVFDPPYHTIYGVVCSSCFFFNLVFRNVWNVHPVFSFSTPYHIWYAMFYLLNPLTQ